MEIVSFKKKKIKLLTNKHQESYENPKFCYICKEKFENRYAKDKSIVKLETNVIVQVNIEVLDIPYLILNIKYLNKLPQFFTGSNHNYFLS